MTTTVRLRDVGATYGGLTGKTKADFGRGNASFVTFLEVINNTRLHGRTLERVRVGKGERQNRVRRGDLLFNGSSETPEEVALSAVVDFEPNTDTYLNSFCFGFRLRPDAEVDPAFLAYLFRSSVGRSLVASLAQGATRYNIAKTKFLEVEIDLPSFDRQREIVEALGDADNFIAALERQIAKAQSIKQGLMQQLLTGRVRLTGFSGSWRDVLAGDVGVFRGGSGFPLRYQGASSGKYPFYKVSDMNLPGNGRSMTRANNYIDDAQRKLIGAVVMPKDAIVFAKVGAAIFQERKRILTQKSCIDNNMAAFVVDPVKVDVDFVHYSLTRFAMGSLVATTAMPSLNGGQLRSIPLSLPPTLDEQRSVARALRDADDEIDLMRRRLGKAQSIQKGMMQSLLTSSSRRPVSEART